MSSSRRIFFKRLAGSSAGIILGSSAMGTSLFKHWPGIDINNGAEEQKNVVFPFYKYAREYYFGEYIPKDQGGMFIQMELLKTEVDEQIVEKIRNGLLEKVYGSPIDWNRFESGELEKSVWLNRFYFLPSFARMFFLTNDKSYVDDMMKMMTVWIKENPLLPDSTKKTYNWRDMQVAWRSIHWSWCYFLTEKVLTEEQKQKIKNSLRQHAGILLEGFGKQPLNEFNHQSHGGLAMLYLGVLFPEFEEAPALRKSAMRILTHHLDKAFYADGGNVEQMFGYYPFETHIFRDTYLLCSQNGLKVPENLLPMLEKMARFISVVAQPDGTMPPINDSYPMQTATSIRVLNDILKTQTEVHSKSSAYFPDTQIGVMRSNKPDNDWYILANPAKTIGSHAHAGRLAFILWHNEHAVLIDSGCCNYDNPELVSWYRTTNAHATALIDAKTDEATSSDHLWAPKRNTENKIAHWLEKDKFLFCRMISPSTEATNNGVSWSRSIALVNNEFLILHDFFQSGGKHNYEILFHFPQVKVDQLDKYNGLLVNETGGLAIIPADKNLHTKIELTKGLVSVKAESVEAPLVKFDFSGEGNVHSVLLFMPGIKNTSSIKLSQESTNDGVGVKIKNGQKKTVVLLKNPESKQLSAFGHDTDQLCAVF
jgi:hypothetical protein